MKKILLALFFIFLLAGGFYFSQCTTKSPQDRAVSAVKNHERLMLGYQGRPYTPFDFGELTPILMEGKQIGYYLDHRFFVVNNPDFYRDLCSYRFFLDNDLRVIESTQSYMKTPEQLDSIGLAVLKGK